MIRSFYLILLLAVQQISYAQTSEGSMMLGGQVNLSSRQSDEGNVLQADLAPDLLVFVQNNLAVGGSVELGVIRYPGSRYNSLGIYPTARYYFGRQQPARFYLLGDIGYHLTSFTFNKEGTARSGLGLGGGPGLAYFFNETVSLEGLAKVRGIRYSNGANSLQFLFRIGIQLYLKPRRY